MPSVADRVGRNRLPKIQVCVGPDINDCHSKTPSSAPIPSGN